MRCAQSGFASVILLRLGLDNVLVGRKSKDVMPDALIDGHGWDGMLEFQKGWKWQGAGVYMPMIN